MKLVKQFTIVLLFSLVGEVLHTLVPLPVPASVWGLILLFIALMMGIVSVEKIKEVVTFLIEIMPLMFIPAGVGLMTVFDVLYPVLLPVGVITVVTTFFVMGVTGRLTQRVIKKNGGK